MSRSIRFDFEEGDLGKHSRFQVESTTKFSTLSVPQALKPQPPAKAVAAHKEVPKESAKPAEATKPAAAAPSKPAASAAAEPAKEELQTYEITPEVLALEAEIETQGKQVVTLKQSKADEPTVKAAVEKLLELKNKLPEGHALRPLSRSDKKKAEKSAEKKPVEPTKNAKKQDRNDVQNEELEKKKMEQLRAIKTDRFGMLTMVQSRPEDKTSRKWTLIGDLGDASLVGRTVLIRGYAHAIKSPSSATFIVLRQRMHTVQCVVEGGDAEMKAYVDNIPVESILDVTGVIVKAEVKATTISSIEIKAQMVFVVQPSRARLPFQPREAERPPPLEGSDEATGAKPTKNILQDVRLDHRTLDLRTPAMQAIARISDAVVRYFAEYLRTQGFVEIMTPKLLAGASEGGAEVFKTDYFGQVACLAQSPQLHKQMCAACSGFERVFEIGPVFRAEKSLTARHMTEFHGLDLEMAINEHYHETLDVFSELFFFIFDKIYSLHRSELEVIRNFSPFEDLVYRGKSNPDKALVLEFSQGIELLEEDFKAQNPGCITKEDLEALKKYSTESDPSTPVEKRLGVLVKQKYGVDFYMLDKYPLAVRPFYTMPDPSNPEHPNQLKSNSYDFFIRGQEILSGAQRVHDPKMLEEHILAKGIPLESLRFYLDAFKDGALPHAGGGIGLERVVMLFLGIPNIRWAALFSRDPKRLIP